MVRAALKPLRAKLAACLHTDPAKPRVARVSMVVNAAGSVEGVFVTPTSTQDCVAKLLRDVRLPATRLAASASRT